MRYFAGQRRYVEYYNPLIFLMKPQSLNSTLIFLVFSVNGMDVPTLSF